MQLANLKIASDGLYFLDRNDQKLSLNQAVTKIINRFLRYLLDIKLFILWLVGYIPSHTLRRLFYFLAGIKIGRGSTIHMGARFFQPRNIQIGQGSIIGDHAFLDGRAQLTIGSHVDIASQVMIYNSEHNLNHPHIKAIEEPVTIGDYVFIGPRAIILPGVNIAKGAVVAAGAVVTKNVPEKTIVAGVPAKPIAKRNIKTLNYKLGCPRLFQ